MVLLFSLLFRLMSVKFLVQGEFSVTSSVREGGVRSSLATIAVLHSKRSRKRTGTDKLGTS